MLARLIGALLVVLPLWGSAALAQGFAFVALGDLPYGSPQQAYPSYRRLIDRINEAAPVFSIHGKLWPRGR